MRLTAYLDDILQIERSLESSFPSSGRLHSKVPNRERTFAEFQLGVLEAMEAQSQFVKRQKATDILILILTRAKWSLKIAGADLSQHESNRIFATALSAVKFTACTAWPRAVTVCRQIPAAG